MVRRPLHQQVDQEEVKASTKPDTADSNDANPNNKQLPWSGDSTSMSYLEALATRPRQGMNNPKPRMFEESVVNK